jgi:Flp pilus assembly protein TadG
MLTVKKRKFGRRSGSSLIETTAGLLVLLPIVLFLVDIVALVLVQTANDSLAKQAARAAAEKADAVTAQTEAQNVVNNYPSSKLLVNPQMVVFTYTNDPVTAVSQVYVRTQVTCMLPIAVPLVGVGQVNFLAEATEPIVAVLPP